MNPQDRQVATIDDVRENERERLGIKTPDEETWALCLSGGGIRSATFCLGVLQGLAKKDLLEKFHYLSTVSGGGYIGGWLSSWLGREGFKTVKDSLSGSVGQASSGEPSQVRRLRAYSNYLSPVWGVSVDFFTLLSTYFRNLLLNWAVIIPLLIAVLLVPRLYLALASLMSHVDDTIGILLLSSIVILLVGGIGYVVADLPGNDREKQERKDRFLVLCFLPVVAAAVILSGLGNWLATAASQTPNACWWFVGAGAGVHALGCVVGGLLRANRRLASGPEGDDAGTTKALLIKVAVVLLGGAIGGGLVYWMARHLCLQTFEHREAYATLAVPALLGAYWIATAAYTGLARRLTREEDREWWSRSGAWWLIAIAGWLLGFGLVIYGPQWILKIDELTENPATVVGSGGILGVVTSLIGYWSKNGATIKERAQGVVAVLGVRMLDLMAGVFTAVLLLGLCLVIPVGLNWAFGEAGQQFSETAGISWSERYSESLNREIVSPRAWLLATVAAGLALASFLVSKFIGTNTFSLHSMYGNRLVRAYLGANRSRRNPHWFTKFDPADNIKMAELPGGEKCKNKEENSPVRLFHVVNVALNMAKASDDHLDWQQRKAASFTISPLHAGCPGLGYVPSDKYSGAKGISLGRAMTISGAAASPNMGYNTSTLVSFVMTFFNVRLGWWSPNPKFGAGRAEPPLGIYSLLQEALAGTTDKNRYVYLSDGGHFENLALYEMVRRRCSHIMVVDAAADPEYGFGDLEDALRKIRIDFGVDIDFDGSLPAPETKCHYVTGTIHYANPGGTEKAGKICYIKPVLVGDEPIDVRNFASFEFRVGNDA